MFITVRVLHLLLADRVMSDYGNLIDEMGAAIKLEPEVTEDLFREMSFLEAYQEEAFELINSFAWDDDVDTLLEVVREKVITVLHKKYPTPDSPTEKPDHSLRIESLAMMIQDYAARVGGQASDTDLPIQEAEAMYNRIMGEG